MWVRTSRTGAGFFVCSVHSVRLKVDRHKARAPLGFSGGAFHLRMDLIAGAIVERQVRAFGPVEIHGPWHRRRQEKIPRLYNEELV